VNFKTEEKSESGFRAVRKMHEAMENFTIALSQDASKIEKNQGKF